MFQVINFSSGEVGYGENEFTGRVGFSAGMPSANLSIFINSTQESDSGRYLCSVIVPGRSGLSGQMHLNVKGTLRQGRWSIINVNAADDSVKLGVRVRVKVSKGGASVHY